MTLLTLLLYLLGDANAIRAPNESVPQVELPNCFTCRTTRQGPNSRSL